jgi:hypothetical protein
LNGIHVSRPLECQLKMSNVQVDQASAKRQKMLKNSRTHPRRRRRTIHELADTVGISYGVCQEILIENLNMRRIAAKFAPRLLTNDKSSGA